MSIGSVRVGESRVAVDIGGTFTDVVLLADGGRRTELKLPSTPGRPEQAVLDGLDRLIEEAGVRPAQVAEVLHGTTVGSNALLEKTGAVTGLITTRGFRDILEIGRIRTPDMFDLQWDKPEPLVPRRLRLEVRERIDASGRVLEPLDATEVLEAGSRLVAAGVTSAAVCFINSYCNPEHEVEAGRILTAAFPDLAVTTSVSVLPEMREYERVSTTVVNAYVLPVLRDYLERLESALRARGLTAPLLVANSNGGLALARSARSRPVFFISSGRSAGVVGAARLGRAVGEEDLVVFDMGGTTASAALVQGGCLSRSKEYEFRAGISTPSRFIKAGGYLMRVPTIDVAEVGSGGGSVAWIDDGGLLRVGPHSAGAEPGPACYSRGGARCTVTDANLVLGYLPRALASGALPLDAERARRAVEDQIGVPLGLELARAAHGVREVANANMARAIRAVTVERGADPRDFTLVAFGGSGPLHACDLARALSIRRVLFPALPGVFTAVGMLAGDLERHFIRALPCRLTELDGAMLERVKDELAEEARAALTEEGCHPEGMRLDFELDLRFLGQDSELPVPLSAAPPSADAIRAAFIDAYRARYHYASADEVEVVNLRLLARGVRPSKVDFSQPCPPIEESTPSARAGREVYLGPEAGWERVPVCVRTQLAGSAEGPLIIEDPDATIAVPRGAQAQVDPRGCLVVELT